MGIDEELRKLKREGAEPARLIIAKLRGGILSPELIRLAADLGNEDAGEAAKLLKIRFIKIGIHRWRAWSYRREVILQVARGIAKLDMYINENSQPLGFKAPSEEFVNRIITLYGCDVVERSLPLFEQFHSNVNSPRETILLISKWAQDIGRPIHHSEIMTQIYDSYSHYYTNTAANDSFIQTSHIAYAAYSIGYAIAYEVKSSFQFSDGVCDALSHLNMIDYYDNTDEQKWQMNKLAEYALMEGMK